MAIAGAARLSYRGTFVQPQDVTAAIVGIGAANIAVDRDGGSPDRFLATVACLVAATSALTGLAAWCFGGRPSPTLRSRCSQKVSWPAHPPQDRYQLGAGRCRDHRPEAVSVRPLGDAVNLASRMESHAENGSIQLSRATYELVRKRVRLSCVQQTCGRRLRGDGRVPSGRNACRGDGTRTDVTAPRDYSAILPDDHRQSEEHVPLRSRERLTGQNHGGARRTSVASGRGRLRLRRGEVGTTPTPDELALPLRGPRRPRHGAANIPHGGRIAPAPARSRRIVCTRVARARAH